MPLSFKTPMGMAIIGLGTICLLLWGYNAYLRKSLESEENKVNSYRSAMKTLEVVDKNLQELYTRQNNEKVENNVRINNRAYYNSVRWE